MKPDLAPVSIPIFADAASQLEEADIAPLLMTYVRLSGDATALDEIGPYINGAWNFMEAVPAARKQKLRECLSMVLAELNAGKRSLPPAPSVALFRKMLSVCVGLPVS